MTSIPSSFDPLMNPNSEGHQTLSKKSESIIPHQQVAQAKLDTTRFSSLSGVDFRAMIDHPTPQSQAHSIQIKKQMKEKADSMTLSNIADYQEFKKKLIDQWTASQSIDPQALRNLFLFDSLLEGQSIELFPAFDALVSTHFQEVFPLDLKNDLKETLRSMFGQVNNETLNEPWGRINPYFARASFHYLEGLFQAALSFAKTHQMPKFNQLLIVFIQDVVDNQIPSADLSTLITFLNNALKYPFQDKQAKEVSEIFQSIYKPMVVQMASSTVLNEESLELMLGDDYQTQKPLYEAQKPRYEGALETCKLLTGIAKNTLTKGWIQESVDAKMIEANPNRGFFDRFTDTTKLERIGYWHALVADHCTKTEKDTLLDFKDTALASLKTLSQAEKKALVDFILKNLMAASDLRALSVAMALFKALKVIPSSLKDILTREFLTEFYNAVAANPRKQILTDKEAVTLLVDMNHQVSKCTKSPEVLEFLCSEETQNIVFDHLKLLWVKGQTYRTLALFAKSAKAYQIAAEKSDLEPISFFQALQKHSLFAAIKPLEWVLYLSGSQAHKMALWFAITLTSNEAIPSEQRKFFAQMQGPISKRI